MGTRRRGDNRIGLCRASSRRWAAPTDVGHEALARPRPLLLHVLASAFDRLARLPHLFCRIAFSLLDSGLRFLARLFHRLVDLLPGLLCRSRLLLIGTSRSHSQRQSGQQGGESLHERTSIG